MSTSPTSERTALLWGRRWWLAGRNEPLEFQALTHAAEILAAHVGPTRCLRLVYQPEFLVTVPVACPRGTRAALQGALGFEHPAITDPAHAWSHEPILAAADGHATFLHYESEPGLFELVERLGAHGVIVTSAWPLATFLHALPAEWSDSGAVCVLAVTAGHGVAYHHPAHDTRAIPQWHGADAAAEATEWLRHEIAERPRDPALLVTTEEPAEELPGVHCLALSDALALPVILPRAHPAQLLPATPLVTPQRTLVAASILLLLTGGLSGAAYAREFTAWTQQQRTGRQEKAALQAEIEHYRVNAAEIVALKTQLAGPGSSPPVPELLDQVCAALPPQIALDRVRVAQGRFALSGHVGPGADWEKWRSRLGSRRWTVEPAVPNVAGAFTLQGAFTP